MTGLLVAGIGVLVAGLLAIGFGIQDKEFEVGKTLILAGSVVASAGFIAIGLAMVVRELRFLARRAGPANAAATPRAKSEPVAAQSSDAGPALRDQPAQETADRVEPSSPAPWQDEAATRDRPRSRSDTPEPAVPEPAPITKPRRNLLFSSSSRKERERAAAKTPDPVADPVAPPPVAPPVPVANEAPPPATFEDAWPQSERARSDAALRRSRTPSTFAEPNPAAARPDVAPPVARSEEPPAVTVLKSGVVDGMAYSLYSDGSIEAQMPEGMMRFASIDELRSHLDQRP